MAEKSNSVYEEDVVPSSDCPDDRTLMRYADRSQSAEKRASVEAHLKQCPACSVFVVELERISEPVVRIHNLSLLGLAWLHFLAGGRLSPKREAAWKLHRDDCEVCRANAHRLERLGLRLTGQSEEIPNTARLRPHRGLSRVLTPALSFGLGMLVMFVVVRPLSTPGPTSGEPPANRGDAERNVNVPIDLSANGVLKGLLVPAFGNLSRQQGQIKTWQALPAEMGLEKQAGLSGFYQRLAGAEKDPARRTELLWKSREALLQAQVEVERRLRSLDNPPAPPPTVGQP